MASKIRPFALMVFAGLPLLASCGSSDAPADLTGSGGAAPATNTGGSTTGTMGITGSGGSSSTGGSPSTGGVTATGGPTAPDGTVGSGGAPPSTGGQVGTGGVTGTGGGIGTGGGVSPASGGGVAGQAPGGRSGGAAAGAAGTGTGGVIPPPAGGKITVWLSGDSTMANDGAGCPVGWGTQFQPYFNSNVTVVDSAAAGRSIQTWLYDPNVTTMMGADGECVVSPKTYSSRWQAMLDGMKAGDFLIVAFGINDGDPTCAKSRHVSKALFQADLEYMAQAAKMKGAQAILMTSTAEMACTGNAVMVNRGFQAETLAAATAANVPIIQLTALTAALYTSLGFCPTDNNFASTTTDVGKFFCDHTHFEATGAVQIAGVVAKALKDQNIALAAYLK